jgi:hypothetical protein
VVLEWCWRGGGTRAAGRGRRAGGGAPGHWKPLRPVLVVDGFEEQFQGKTFFVFLWGFMSVMIQITIEECSVFVDFIKNRGVFTKFGGHQAEESAVKPIFPIVGGSDVTRSYECLIITIGVVGVVGVVTGEVDYR